MFLRCALEFCSCNCLKAGSRRWVCAFFAVYGLWLWYGGWALLRILAVRIMVCVSLWMSGEFVEGYERITG
jgi:hypothetical protein